MSFYSLVGIKRRHNIDLHITSHRFDEPRFLDIAAKHEEILAIHGCTDRNDSKTLVWVGGADSVLALAMINQLIKAGFPATIDTSLPGKEPQNVCNRGRREKGLQLEISDRLRAQFFGDLRSRKGRETILPILDKFAAAVKAVLVD